MNGLLTWSEIQLPLHNLIGYLDNYIWIKNVILVIYKYNITRLNTVFIKEKRCINYASSLLGPLVDNSLCRMNPYLEFYHLNHESPILIFDSLQ